MFDVFVICDSCGNYGSNKGEQIDIISFNCHENGQLDTSAIVYISVKKWFEPKVLTLEICLPFCCSFALICM